MRAMTAKERVALISILATVTITIAKGVGGWITGSLALQSDAAQSLLDVAATTITYLVVRAADRPPDEEHPYGHGRYEYIPLQSMEKAVEVIINLCTSAKKPQK